MNILLIDEDISTFDLIRQSQLVDRCELFITDDIKELLLFLNDFKADIIIMDIDKNKTNSLAALQEIKKNDSILDVVFTGKPMSTDNVMDLLSMGATDYLDKPIQEKVLDSTLGKISSKKTLRKDTLLLEKQLEKKYYFQGIVGKSPYMLEIFSLIEKIAKYFSSILITGETGTGKEMIAHAVHAVSPHKKKKLVICDCVSIPDNLFESELFGYSKGAFTGADRDRKGLFEEAHGGIIFLDEIGEIPLPVQAKLLRVLDYHQYRPLGSNQIKKADVRIIAATNCNLKENIKKGLFREDLYHRLNKVEIQLPPLREKKEDILLLVRYFLDSYNKKFEKNIRGISQQVQKLFLKYDWPGNIRELENVLERAIMINHKDFIDIEDLPPDLQETFTSRSEIPFINKENLSTLEELEKEYIIYLLKHTDNNMRQTAKILNISRTTLYNKLEKFNIPR